MYCTIDGANEPFPVDINHSDKGSDFQEKIKMKQHIRFNNLQAEKISLYKAPVGVGPYTEPGVTVGVEDAINANSSLHGMFAETDDVQVIVQPPSTSFYQGYLGVVFHKIFCLQYN